MARCGKVKFNDLKKFQKDLEKLQDGRERFLRACTQELAARVLTNVIKMTPVGDYSKNIIKTGKMGGTLRRNWTVELSKTMNGVNVSREGDRFIIELVNPTEYASYVEYGHRQEPGRYVPTIGKKLKAGWVRGNFALTKSVSAVEAGTPIILERKLKKWLGEVFE